MGGIVTHDGSASGDEPVAAINVTSLIDIMFCLLIGFMVATPLMNQEQVAMDIPHAIGVEITEEEFEYSVVSVDAKGRVFVGSLPLDADKAVTAYAYARTGYHRGLDQLRRNGWKGFGPVPYGHEPNRGFLRCVAALARAADDIGETDEFERCRDLLDDCDPTARAELGLA